MADTFLESGVDFQHRGYFADLIPSQDLADLPKSERDGWLAWQARFVEAKEGRFDRIVELVDVYEICNDWQIRGACADLLGDAGNDACLRLMRERIGTNPDAIIALMMNVDFPYALAATGRLDYVPTIVEAYRKVHTFGDADILPCELSRILEPMAGSFCEPKGFPSIDAYCAAVLAKNEELSARFGSTASLLAGEPYSVSRVARIAKEALATKSFSLKERQQFEAATGIDASAFYKGLALQPLTGAAIIEDFLSSPASARYEDGVRYFFGHRIR